MAIIQFDCLMPDSDTEALAQRFTQLSHLITRDGKAETAQVTHDANHVPNYNKNTTHQHTSPCIDMWCILREQPDPLTRWLCSMPGSSHPQRTSPIMP